MTGSLCMLKTRMRVRGATRRMRRMRSSPASPLPWKVRSQITAAGRRRWNSR